MSAAVLCWSRRGRQGSNGRVWSLTSSSDSARRCAPPSTTSTQTIIPPASPVFFPPLDAHTHTAVTQNGPGFDDKHELLRVSHFVGGGFHDISALFCAVDPSSRGFFSAVPPPSHLSGLWWEWALHSAPEQRLRGLVNPLVAKRYGRRLWEEARGETAPRRAPEDSHTTTLLQSRTIFNGDFG